MAKRQKKFDTHNETPDNVRHLARKKFHPHDLISVRPKTDRQSQFFEYLYNDDTRMILQSGYAGTGKSFTALYGAMSLVLEPSTPYDQVVIFRSAVQSRNIGFTKGDLDEKAAVYEAPYRAICSEIFNSYNDTYDHLKVLGYLDFQLTSFQRGNTYHDSILLIEECQNMDVAELLTIVTRAGNNCLIILTGDGKLQNDLARQREKTCFGYLQDLMKMMPYGMAQIVDYKLEDIVRSGLVKEILIADSQLDKSKY